MLLKFSFKIKDNFQMKSNSAGVANQYPTLKARRKTEIRVLQIRQTYVIKLKCPTITCILRWSHKCMHDTCMYSIFFFKSGSFSQALSLK